MSTGEALWRAWDYMGLKGGAVLQSLPSFLKWPQAGCLRLIACLVPTENQFKCSSSFCKIFPLLDCCYFDQQCSTGPCYPYIYSFQLTHYKTTSTPANRKQEVCNSTDSLNTWPDCIEKANSKIKIELRISSRLWRRKEVQMQEY